MSEQISQDTLKSSFLEAYKALGYLNRAANQVTIESSTVQYWLKTDPTFKIKYQILKETWKEARKEVLESTMYDRGLTPGGYMDRITWLRKHYPEEYNPKAIVTTEKGEADERLKKLSEKLNKYKEGDSKDVK